MRKLALQAQASTWQHRNPLSLWCELGFLFHSMQLIEDQLQSGDRGGVSKVARASSFVSTYHSYRKSHDVVALGLFDDSIHQNLQLTSQLFFQFFLKQICKEKIDSKISPKFVDEIFGLQSVSTTTFLQSKVTETDKSLTKSNHLELFYSQSEEFKSTRCNMTSNITSSRSTWSGKRGSSFSKCLWDGLRKETYMRYLLRLKFH